MDRPDLKSLQPLRNTMHTMHSSTLVVWLSTIFAWLCMLLPWRTIYTPDVLLVMLLFWNAHSARGMGLLTAFVFGLLMDVQDAATFGTTSLTYVLSTYCVIKIRKRMMYFNVFGQMIYTLPIFLFAQIPERIFEAWHAGGWIGWAWLWVGFFNCLLWLAVHLVLRLPWQHTQEDEAVV